LLVLKLQEQFCFVVRELTMSSYELRLLDAQGRTQAILKFESDSDMRAKARVKHIIERYYRFELWRGMSLVAGGFRVH
jgi:hypothetical protein